MEIRNALATDDTPSAAPTRIAGSMRIGPTIEPTAEPQTIRPIARPRCAPGLMSAAAYRARRFEVLAVPNSAIPARNSAKLCCTTPSMPSAAPTTASE